jgi:predicted DNA-binding ribbon-helix-helix protein
MGGVLGLLKEGGVKKEKIEELCGKKKISIEDTFWTELLHFEIAEEATLNSASLNSVLQQLSTQLCMFTSSKQV